MKRIEQMADLFAHLMTRSELDETPFNRIWDFYFAIYHDKYGIGNMNVLELQHWLLEEVEDDKCDTQQ